MQACPAWMEQSKLKVCESQAPELVAPFDANHLAAEGLGNEDPAGVPMQLAEMVQAMRLDVAAGMKIAPGWLGKMPTRGLEKLRWCFLAEGLVRPLVASGRPNSSKICVKARRAGATGVEPRATQAI